MRYYLFRSVGVVHGFGFCVPQNRGIKLTKNKMSPKLPLSMEKKAGLNPLLDIKTNGAGKRVSVT